MKTRTIYGGDPARGWLPWGALAPFLALVFVAVPLMGTAFFLQEQGMMDEEGGPVGPYGLYTFLAVPFSAIAIVLLAWILIVERRPLATVGLAGPGGLPKFFAGHLTGLVTICAVVAGAFLAGGYALGAIAPALQSPQALQSIAVLLVGFALQASVEEFVFRGWLFSTMSQKLGLIVAFIVPSLLFTLLHFNPANHWLMSVNIFLFAIFASAWAWRAGSIWGVMGWHAGWNWLLAVGFELPVTGYDAHIPALLVQMRPLGDIILTGGAAGPESSIATTILFVAATGFLLLRPSRK